MTSLFFQEETRVNSSGFVRMCYEIAEFVIGVTCYLFNVFLRLAKGVLMTLIFFSPMVLFCLVESFFLDHAPKFFEEFIDIKINDKFLNHYISSWVDVTVKGNAHYETDFDKITKMSELDKESLKHCDKVLVVNAPKVLKFDNFVKTCEVEKYICHGFETNISSCAASNPGFLQGAIEIVEKPCECSKWLFGDLMLQCHYIDSGLWKRFEEKTFSVINVFDEDSLRYQIIVPRLDNLRAKNKGKKDYKYYER